MMSLARVIDFHGYIVWLNVAGVLGDRPDLPPVIAKKSRWTLMPRKRHNHRFDLGEAKEKAIADILSFWQHPITSKVISLETIFTSIHPSIHPSSRTMSPLPGNKEEEGESKITHVYLPSAEHGWLPALQLKSSDNKATVAVPKFRKEDDLLTCTRTDRWHYYYQDNQIVDLAKFPNNVLPMQNVDHNGNLVEYKDMVELPFMHEVRICSVLCCAVLSRVFVQQPCTQSLSLPHTCTYQPKHRPPFCTISNSVTRTNVPTLVLVTF